MDEGKTSRIDFLKGGVDFEALVYEESLKIREQSKIAYGSLLDARLALMAVANELFRVKDLTPGNTDATISERLLLATVFFQGIYAIETLISEGQYIKAAAAIKQDYELLARMGEIAAGKHLCGQTPNAKYAPEGSQWYYGELNNVAHIAKSDLLQRLMGQFVRGEIVGVSPIPKFVPEVAKALYELHVFLLLQMCREMIKLHIDLYGDDRELEAALRSFLAATKALQRAGWTIEDASGTTE